MTLYQTKKPRLKKEERQQLITECLINRYTVEQTIDYVFKRTNRLIGSKTIQRDKKEINKQATKFFYLLAKDNDEYSHKLKLTIDNLEDTLADLTKEYKNSSDINIKLKIAELRLRYEKEVYEYYKFLPMTASMLQNQSERDNQSKREIEIETEGLEHQPWDIEDWLQCSSCTRWFRNEVYLESHKRDRHSMTHNL